MVQARSTDEKRVRPKVDGERQGRRLKPQAELPGVAGLQQRIGNRAVQRLLAQRSGNQPAEVDEETTARISRERGGGRPLDAAVQAQAGEAMGHDLSDVRVHTSPEADSLSRSLGAKAFTTGRDVFFRAGAYEPQSSSGQELIHHELTHVVQQSLGPVGGGGPMTVNPPGDAFEQEADAVAGSLAGAAAPQVQRQETPEEEQVQAQAGEEEEDLQMQGEEEEEEEEAVQMQSEEEEEEEEAMP